MNLLALETSTEYCSVALSLGGALTARCALVGQKHSELLMPMLDDVLCEAGVRLVQLDGIAFGSGPGSFTGVRIACGVTQGLALGANLPIVGICTLLALAEASGQDKVVAALDARMGEIYHAVYEKRDGRWVTVVEPNLCKAEDAPQVAGAGWFGVGSGFSVGSFLTASPPGGGGLLAARYAGQLAGVDASAIPQAAAIARLAAPLFAAGHGVDAALATPFYLRDKVALTTQERAARSAQPA
ncbi:MAG: tRNA (adenosine(37)-N6)-threonylcarbamoyltransferase complex dimerization subunit type 1 TsaB [Nitrosomonadales bacterium]|nr:tRNA (adenosine(37)-N6)-threonylcarbamoyltransferase complex dimerization subunit type 1 TsaB [Nitrosomonadales bacterium]